MKILNFIFLAVTITLVNSMAIKDEFFQRFKSLEESSIIKNNNIDCDSIFNGFNNLMETICKLLFI